MLLTDMLTRNAERDPKGLAYVFLDDHGHVNRQLTHDELAQEVATLGDHFLDRGWSGKTAFLIFDHGPEFALVFHACLRAGITSVPLPAPDLGKLDFQVHYWKNLLEDTGADLILSTGNAYSLLTSVMEKLSRENPVQLHDIHPFMNRPPEKTHQAQSQRSDRAALLYTSGSTSAPKGVAIHHEHLIYNAQSCCECWDIDTISVLTTWMPNHHSFGLIYNVLLPAFSGCTLVSLSTGAFVGNPRLWFEMVHRFKGTHGAAATFGWQLCTDRIKNLDNLDLSSWRVGLISAEPVRRGVCDQFMEAFGGLGLPNAFFCALYGLSETGPITSMPVNTPSRFYKKSGAPDHLALACVGQQLPGTRVRCVNPETMAVCEDGANGEIWVSGPSVMAGYHRRDEVNQQAFAKLSQEPENTYFRTGDQGFSQDGFVYITGRLKEIIIVRGRNYYPQDIEWLGRECQPQLGPGASAAFVTEQEDQQITLVMEVAASQVGDEANGSRIVGASGAFIAQKLGLSIHEIVLVPPQSIPKTASGKIKRAACCQALESDEMDVLYRETLAGETTAVSDTPDTSLDFVRHLFAQALSIAPQDVDPTRDIGDFQVDSMGFLEMARAIETRQGEVFHPANFFRFQSLEELAAHLDQEKGREA